MLARRNNTGAFFRTNGILVRPCRSLWSMKVSWLIFFYIFPPFKTIRWVQLWKIILIPKKVDTIIHSRYRVRVQMTSGNLFLLSGINAELWGTYFHWIKHNLCCPFCCDCRNNLLFDHPRGFNPMKMTERGSACYGAGWTNEALRDISKHVFHIYCSKMSVPYIGKFQFLDNIFLQFSLFFQQTELFPPVFYICYESDDCISPCRCFAGTMDSVVM